MRQKELRIALVCYGGISLAVYMHGVTKELWHATRASRAFHCPDDTALQGVEAVYLRLLDTIAATRALRLRILPDIISGASAGGINGVFLAQAISTGQSLEPLTAMWLDRADIDALLDPDAKPWSRFAKFWAQPLVWFVLKRPGNVVSSTVAPETRSEVRRKVSRLIRARWFAPPFSGIGFSRMIADALDAMAKTPMGDPLLPEGHPLDLLVTATDFNGHLEELRLNSPEVVVESEHRLSIGFRRATTRLGDRDLAPCPELVLAARSTASFPGAFPPLVLDEIDQLVAERGTAWPTRQRFIERVMPTHARRGTTESVALVDGAVLVNRPFAQAIDVLRDRPARREVDRRFVYIDPSPDHMRIAPKGGRTVGFFSAIFGSLSSIPREQPIRDNLEALERQSRQRARLRVIVDALRPEIEETVETLFGRTLFFDWPNQRRLTAWRNKAQQAAAERAGFAFHGYAQTKLSGIVADLACLIHQAAPQSATEAEVEAALWRHLAANGLDRLSALRGGATPEAVAFFRTHDLSFRIRRLKLLARRLTRDWDDGEVVDPASRELARDAVYRAQALYQGRETAEGLGPGFASAAALATVDPGAVLNAIAARRDLITLDLQVDALLVAALEAMDKPLRRRFLHAYLGFPFYDTATLPLLQGEGMGEFDPVKVDRISPDDATSIRKGGTFACLRGVEFFNFGAFFSRAYRENDYLWGRLHGAERTIDLIASTVEEPLDAAVIASFKRDAFLAILDEEHGRLIAEPGLIDRLRAEVTAAFA
ncbi:MAG: patatin [Novosphingobium sp. 28-62-57]|uniref:patatin-like protein n=1 Tax=unclassified Novosphingobium TaxID=2644732 RepID=UPI000BDA0FF0|nr:MULTISPECIES: patatin-like protein [unclassified Novosphingobium]OYW49662.1 MAG: patatin [Novosphingobium sp. 12-62-10]OYZ12381.1 MAG: patatin [Novosphingobium sp. 28-62-57]